MTTFICVGCQAGLAGSVADDGHGHGLSLNALVETEDDYDDDEANGISAVIMARSAVRAAAGARANFFAAFLTCF
jgi:hypothetical protein